MVNSLSRYNKYQKSKKFPNINFSISTYWWPFLQASLIRDWPQILIQMGQRMDHEKFVEDHIP